MKSVHDGRKLKVYSRVKIPQEIKKGAHKGYLYFLQIGDKKNRKFKIGTANNIIRRMKEHASYYKEPIYLLWVSPVYSKYTTLRIEDRVKDYWKANFPDWEYIENDRFLIPEHYVKVKIKVKKVFEILLE